jgi:hypothetical protein
VVLPDRRTKQFTADRVQKRSRSSMEGGASAGDSGDESGADAASLAPAHAGGGRKGARDTVPSASKRHANDRRSPSAARSCAGLAGRPAAIGRSAVAAAPAAGNDRGRPALGAVRTEHARPAPAVSTHVSPRSAGLYKKAGGGRGGAVPADVLGVLGRDAVLTPRQASALASLASLAGGDPMHGGWAAAGGHDSPAAAASSHSGDSGSRGTASPVTAQLSTDLFEG